MDAKEIKRVLKEAKEAIKNKDSKTAINLCKSVLKEDKNNYIALVLFGASLQESDQHEEAPKTFKKACVLSPDQPLAWQGLVSYYEKHGKSCSPDAEAELLKAYSHLIPLEANSSKKEELTMKLCELSVKLQCPTECCCILSSLPNDVETSGNMRRILVKALIQIKELKEPDSTVFGEQLERIVLDWKLNRKGIDFDIQEFYRQFLKYLYLTGQHKKLLHEAQIMAETFNKDPYPLEWICKLWVEFVAERKDVTIVKDSIANVVSTLEQISPSATSSICMANGAIHFFRREFAKAREELSKAVMTRQAPWEVYFLLAETELKFGCPLEALSVLTEAKSKIKQISSEQEYLLKNCEAEALTATMCDEKVERAVQLCDELLAKRPTDSVLHLTHARASITLKRFKEAQSHLTEIGSPSPLAVKVTLLEAQILSLSGQKTQALFVLESLAADAKDHEVWLTLAKLHEETGKQENVLTDLMEAARCEPVFWETFMLLGNYYKTLSTTAALDKARRCYQKALQLNPKSVKVGEYLSDVLLLLRDVESNIHLLDMMTQASNAKWIWLRLGLLHTESGQVEKAITYLCNAVRSDPLDCRIWESLGDAYMFRGAWHAALKSFQKVMQLSPGNIYAAFQIGTVKLRMEDYEDALIAFRELLKLSADYVPALQGQGEAAFRWAQTLRQEQRLGCARDCCQEAIDALAKVLNQRRDLSCTWKLLGDVCLLGAKLPVSYGNFHLPEWLVCEGATSSGTNTLMLKKMDMFPLAERMYCHAMSINQDNSLLWHDLAATNYWYAMMIPQSNKRSDILLNAMVAACRGVKLNPLNAIHWNLLGVIAASEEIKQRGVAQHAFIKSIELDSTSPVPWTNLGTLYFILGDITLANKSFSAAQRVHHDYTRCWVGQAMIAESLSHHETMDLFRHAASLQYHPESCAGYAHWVLITLLDQEKVSKIESIEQDMTLRDMKNMSAVEMATDCMKWYSERHQSDPCGWNMLGLLLERQKLFRSARAAFQKGLEEAILMGVESHQMDAISCNLGRVLTNLQDHQQAIATLQSVSLPNFPSQSTLALALYKAQKFEEAYKTYSGILEWLAPDIETKAFILMAMAAVQYSFNQVEECKTLLFQSIHPKPLSAHPLLALCAIGLLHQDIAMSKIMLKELVQFRDDPRYLSHIGLLAAFTSFLQGDQKGAVRALAKAVHRHPGEGALWLSLAHVQMHAYPKCDAPAIGRTAEAALYLGRSHMDISKVQSVVSVAQMLSDNSVSAAISSQKAVHQFPNVAENWSTFVASVLPQNNSCQHAAWLCDLISHVRRRLQPSAGALKKWLGNCEHRLTSLASQ